MSGKHYYNVQSFTPEALARIAKRKGRKRKGRLPKGIDTRHRADPLIDAGDTLADLRAAWGKEPISPAAPLKPAYLANGKPVNMAKVEAALRRFGG